MSEVEKNEEIEFNVEDGVVDSEELRAEDYRKYRELYKLLAKINQLPDNYAHPEKKEAFKELMDHKLYSDAVKSPFFIDKLAQSIEEGGFNFEMSCMLEADLRSYLKSGDPKYAKLQYAITDAHLYHSHREPEGQTIGKKRNGRKFVAALTFFVIVLILFAVSAFIRWFLIWDGDSIMLFVFCIIGVLFGIVLIVRTIIYDKKYK